MNNYADDQASLDQQYTGFWSLLRWRRWLRCWERSWAQYNSQQRLAVLLGPARGKQREDVMTRLGPKRKGWLHPRNLMAGTPKLVVHSLKLTLMIGRLVSFWDSFLAGATLVSGCLAVTFQGCTDGFVALCKVEGSEQTQHLWILTPRKLTVRTWK